MLTDALETALFVSVFMWPIALPLLLGALGCLIYLIVYAVKNWRKRSVRIGTGVAVVCVLLFAGVLGVEGQPYSESAARRRSSSIWHTAPTEAVSAEEILIQRA